ncbi:MAG: S41 family peptidase [Muribaculaceae bacterium]|nr:S41 family peptidase [Muribaculaceae bacterium]
MNSKDGNNRNYIKYLYMLPAITALALVAGIWIGTALSRSSDQSAARQKLNEVFDIIEESYVDEVSLDSIVDISLREILTNLDPHSVYISASERARSDRELESSFYGIGIQFQMQKDTVYVVEVITGGAAEEAGMQAGDRIVKVDGRDITGPEMTTDSVFSMLRGPEGTPVDVSVKRFNSPDLIDYRLVRVEIPVTPVDASYMLNDSTGYLKISKFSDATYPDFIRNFNELRFKGAKSLVLDLRGNTGGYMQPAVLMANEFFGTNTVLVSTRGRQWRDNSVLGSDRTGSFAGERVVVLIDEYTASASEIFAGAIQDNDRGLIVGRRSFGKGLVQHPFELEDSSLIRLTVQRYYTPSGRCIQKTFHRGKNSEYAMDLMERYNHGESFVADSIKVDSTQVFETLVTGRTVYGGGGIMPDVFVPADTTGVTPYYLSVANAGLLQKYAFEFSDLNRDNLSEATTTGELLELLPSDAVLLQSFVKYANDVGNVRPRWYYIEPSRRLIVNQIKGLIARDILGLSSYYEVINATDPVVKEAIEQIKKGGADFPIQTGTTTK